jgi:hypothetical protein
MWLMSTKIARAIAVGLLLCSLAALEIPELIGLVDDTSNDYSLLLITRNAPTASVRVHPPSEMLSVRAEVLRRYADSHTGIGSAREDPRDSQDMLQLLCVRRT